MKSNGLHYEGPRLNGVILTSETVTKADTQLIEGYLNTNVINEYGMAETGAIAYSFRKTDNIRVFWDSFIVTSNKQKDLMLTTIGDSIFPLINYSSEDLAEVKSEYKASILSLRKVLGKARDVLNVCMLDGSKKEISTIFFDHVLKFYPDIYSIHYQQDRSDVVIFLTSDKRLNLRDVKSYLYKEISKEFHNIDYSHLSVVQVDDVKKTIAGKNKTFLSL
jgi:phenylacetate-coenzyme A ligase PaaK-like adenylate-forming protein